MASDGNRFAGRIISILLSILIFILTCTFTALLLMRVDNVATIIRNTDIYEILEDTELAYYLVHQLNSLPFHDTEIELSDIEAFIQTEAVSNEIGGILNEYARAFNNNDLDFHLTADDVLGIVHNLEPELQDLFDHHLTEADNIIITRTLDDILDFNGLTISGIMYDAGIDIMVPRLLISPLMLWGVGILILVTLCLIFLLNTKTIPNAFLLSGIPMILSGLLYLTTGVIFGTYPDLLSGTLHSLSRYTAGVMHLVIRYGVVLSALGVTLIVICINLKRNKEAKKKTEKN